MGLAKRPHKSAARSQNMRRRLRLVDMCGALDELSKGWFNGGFLYISTNVESLRLYWLYILVSGMFLSVPSGVRLCGIMSGRVNCRAC